MELKEAKKIIQAGLTWANWTSEQQEAMKIALHSIAKVEEQQEVKELGEIKASLKERKEQMSIMLTPTHKKEIRKMADSLNISVSELIGYWVDQYPLNQRASREWCRN